MVKMTFSVPGARKPEHMIYDSNCSALKEVEACDDTWFKGVGMCVDAFHLRTKHKASDLFCRTRCDPKHYPELINPDGSWYFNSLIAKQTNVWLGGYHSIVWEMLPVKFNFFLDEMIMRHNWALVLKMEKAGQAPCNAPLLVIPLLLCQILDLSL
jgi:hypothetical protein